MFTATRSGVCGPQTPPDRIFKSLPMNAIHIPINAISAGALDALLEEFVTRDGTDYGTVESSLGEKKAAVMTQLERNDAVIVFDPDSESCNIVLKAELAGI